MLELYVLKDLRDDDRFKLCNDAYFSYAASYGMIKFDDFVKRMIREIDKSEYIGDFRIKSRFGDYTVLIDKLSTGCKTVINIYSMIDRAFFIGECGKNALERIFSLKQGKCYTNTFFIPPKFSGKIDCYFEYTGETLVLNRDELEDKLFEMFDG